MCLYYKTSKPFDEILDKFVIHAEMGNLLKLLKFGLIISMHRLWAIATRMCDLWRGNGPPKYIIETIRLASQCSFPLANIYLTILYKKKNKFE